MAPLFLSESSVTAMRADWINPITAASSPVIDEALMPLTSATKVCFLKMHDSLSFCESLLLRGHEINVWVHHFKTAFLQGETLFITI